MKSHAFVRENAPRAIVYGQIYSQESKLFRNLILLRIFSIENS